MTLWLTVAAAGIGTFLIRGSMLIFLRHDALPPTARDALRYVMPAVLSAIAVPVVLYPGDSVGDDGPFDAGLGNERLVAALVAVVVARISRSVWLTIGAGMATLWAITAIT